jgi:multiple sugar transport system permease protein
MHDIHKNHAEEVNELNKKIQTSMLYLLQIVVAVLFTFPLYWLFKVALSERLDVITYPPLFFPQHPIIDNFMLFFQPTRFGGAFDPMVNSIIAAGSSTIFTIILSVFMAYSFSRFKTGGDNLPFFVLTIRMMPPIAAVIPLFLVMKAVGLLDNLASLIIIYTVFNIPFAVWMLKGFFDDIPSAIEESAYVDGASKLKTLLKITLPLIVQGIAVTAIFSFIFSWNEFLFAFIMTRQVARTLPVHLSGMHIESPHGIDWGPISAASIMASIPAFVMAMIIRKHIVRGLTLGAVKG